MDPHNNLDPDHYFYDFNLTSHNANADQMEKVAERKRLAELALRADKKPKSRIVIRASRDHVDLSSTAIAS